MKKPAQPAWPDPAGLPFSLFGAAGGAGDAPAGATTGLAAGVDWMKSFLGKLPGGSSMPGFLVPTVDVDELDKRISDLRAAESWVEVNLNMLRATIQGLEVQRHTIAAIHSWSAMSDPTKQAATGQATGGGLPPGWPMGAPSAAPAPAPEPPPQPFPPAEAPREWPAAPAAWTTPSPAPSEPAPETSAPSEAAPEPDASEAGGGAADATPPGASPIAALAANNWLGFMQDQFNRVAQAALTSGEARAAAPAAAAKARPKPAKKAAKTVARKRGATK